MGTLADRTRGLQLAAAIALGGALGALARAGLTDVWTPRVGTWPWATFAANVGGAFLLGFFATRLQERLPPSTLRRPLLGTGFCGALTTFSTLDIELLRLGRQHCFGLAAGYLAASLVCGFAAVFVATHLVRARLA
jgi:CrcB protein